MAQKPDAPNPSDPVGFITITLRRSEIAAIKDLYAVGVDGVTVNKVCAGLVREGLKRHVMEGASR